MIDIIIATYNRPDVISALVDDILKRQIPILNKVIVVDSTDQLNNSLMNCKGVEYIHSVHKNQPYQRYLGFCLAQAENLLFLDDDMLILDERVFCMIEEVLSDDSICGINLDFQNLNSFLSQQYLHNYGKDKKNLVRILQTLSGRPVLKDGQMWYCGLRGKRVDGYYSEYFSGGAFAAKRIFLYRNFNFNLFTLFEHRIGMGEDIILAYTLSKFGKIYNMPGKYFLHNEQGNSTYTATLKSYQYRVAYSRQYLSNEFARLNDRNPIEAYLITLWYNLWRSVGLLILGIKNTTLSGYFAYLKGTFMSIGLFNQKDRTDYWHSEIKANL